MYQESAHHPEPEQREKFKHRSCTLFEVSPTGVVTNKIPCEIQSLNPIHSRIQLLKDMRTEQYALVLWPEEAFTTTSTEEGLKEFNHPEGYKTTYDAGHYEEIGLYSSIQDVKRTMDLADQDYDPFVHMQDMIDTHMRSSESEDEENEDQINTELTV